MNINLVYGPVNQQVAHIYARVDPAPDGGPWTLEGLIRGPRSRLGHTLPANFSFRPVGSEPGLGAEAVITEPCFWSPRSPLLYDVSLKLRRGPVVEQEFNASLGIRLLGCHKNSLRLEQDRWVLRGVQARSVFQSPLEDWRDAAAAAVLVDPTEEQCWRASEQGILIVAKLTGSERLRERLSCLSRWAAVGAAVLPADVKLPNDVRRVAPNLLLADWLTADQDLPPAPWAQLVFYELAENRRIQDFAAACPIPIIAVRSLNEVQSLSAARRGCDLLQRDLAPGGDYAGYVV